MVTAGRGLVTSLLPRRQTGQMRGSTRWSAWSSACGTTAQCPAQPCSGCSAQPDTAAQPSPRPARTFRPYPARPEQPALRVACKCQQSKASHQPTAEPGSGCRFSAVPASVACLRLPQTQRTEQKTDQQPHNESAACINKRCWRSRPARDAAARTEGGSSQPDRRTTRSRAFGAGGS